MHNGKNQNQTRAQKSLKDIAKDFFKNLFDPFLAIKMEVGSGEEESRVAAVGIIESQLAAKQASNAASINSVPQSNEEKVEEENNSSVKPSC